MKRFAKVLLLSIAMLLLIAIPVFAQTYSYRAPYTVTDGTAYDMLGVTTDVNVEWMSDNGFMTASALDTRIETLGGLTKPWMVAEDRINTAVPIPADSQTNLFFTTGNSLATSMDIIPADGGYITVSDDATLELGADFELKFEDAYFDTSAATTILSKAGAIEVGTDGSGNIYASIPVTDPVDVTPISFASWVDMDLSSYIPGGATGVILQVVTEDKDCGFRKPGSTDARIQHMYHTYVMIGVDANGICEAYIEDATVAVYLIGYTDSSWTFKTDADDVSIGAGAWTNIDVTAITSTDCVGVVVEIVNNDVAGKQGALRNDGSGDVRTKPLNPNSHFWFVVGVDVATEIFEGFVNDTDVDFYLVGYVTAGATFKVNADNKAIGAGVWTDIDCSVQAPGATFLFFEASQTVGGDNNFGFRPNGSAFAVTGIVNLEKSNAVVPCDGGQITEGFVDNANLDFFLQGYATSGIYTPVNMVLSAQTTGDYDVEVALSGGTLSLTINTVLEDSGASGAVPGNGNDWILGNEVPYFGGYEHIVSGVTHAYFSPNYIVENTGLEGIETAGGSKVLLTAVEITEGVDYWVGARVIITSAGGVAPEGEISIVTASAVGDVTISPELTVNIDIGDEFTLDFATLIDRSMYGLDFDGTGDEVVVTDAASIQNIFDGGGSIALWTDCTSDGENNEGRLADKLQWHVRVDNEAAGEVHLTFFVDFDGITDGEWTTTATELVIGDWTNIVITYDADAVANNPIFYIDGTALTVGAGLTETTAPVGARVTDVGDDLYMGDNAAGNRCYDGVIDEWWLFDDILTQANVTADYNSGDGAYVPNNTTDIQVLLHIEDGSGATATDTSGNGNDGAITNASWVDGFVERTAGLAGTFDSRITWGINPTGITATLGSFISSGTQTPSIPSDTPTVDYLPAVEGTDLYVDPDVTGALLTNPFRPFVTILSDTTSLSELLAWRLLAMAFVIGVTVLAGTTVRGHLLVAGIVAGASIGWMVGMTIFPLWALIFIVVVVAAGVVSERSHSL